MDNRKKKNKLDVLIETLAESFLKIKNFETIAEDETARKAFNEITFRIADVSSYKELVLSHFIPATNRALFDAKQELRNSKYKQLIDLSQFDLNETLYETIA